MQVQPEEARSQLRPRPALGRRPWFALLRRARILRRFALAMTGERTRTRRLRNRALLLVGETSSDSVLLANTPYARRRGLQPAPGPVGLLIRGRSLIGWGMAVPVRWYGLDADGVVTDGGVLRPGWVACAPRSTRWMVEVAEGTALPTVGDRVTAVPILAVWPDD